MDFSNTLFRSSQTGKIMTDPRKGSQEPISETTKAYLIEVMIQRVYHRRKDIINKFIQKGQMVEEDAITLLSRYQKRFFKKNEESLKNDFLTGTPDIFTGEDIHKAECIYDTKSSWDIWTFWKAKTESINKDYYWQMQSYMDLTGSPIAFLVYALVNTPPVFIESAKRKILWDAGVKETDISEVVLQQIENNAIYDDIAIDQRIHLIKIDRNQEDISRLHERVKICRQWMNENFGKCYSTTTFKDSSGIILNYA